MLHKSAAETYRVLVDAYGNNVSSERSCREYFQQFRNNNFDFKEEEHAGAPKKFEELVSLLDEDPCQTLKKLSDSLSVEELAGSKRLRPMGLFHKLGNWLPYDLKEGDIQEGYHCTNCCFKSMKGSLICKELETRKKRKKLWVRPEQLSKVFWSFFQQTGQWNRSIYFTIMQILQ